jgi:hypothetical protein
VDPKIIQGVGLAILGTERERHERIVVGTAAKRLLAGFLARGQRKQQQEANR